MNIAIFGGTFDPPHNAHDLIIKTAIKTLNIDKLIVVPAFLNPFKTQFFATPEERFRLCEILWSDLERVEISNYEIAQNKPTATINSVLHFQKIYNPNKIYLIIGADQLENLDKWHEISRLKTLVNFVVATRDNVKIPQNLQKLDINVKISSTKIRQELDLSQIPSQIRALATKIYKGK